MQKSKKSRNFVPRKQGEDPRWHNPQDTDNTKHIIYMGHSLLIAEIVDFSVDFDRMAKSQGIYELTKGFNIADTLNSFFPNGEEE